jgi:hypothetical protein
MDTIARVGLAVLLAAALGASVAAQKPKTMTAQGRVTAVSGDSLTIAHGSDSLTFAVDTSTRVTGKGLGTMAREKKAKNEGLTITEAVAKDDLVKVTYHDAAGKMHAAQVVVVEKALANPTQAPR